MSDVVLDRRDVWLKWAALVPLVPALTAIYVSYHQTVTIEKVHWTELGVVFTMASLWLQGLRLLRTSLWIGVMTLTIASLVAGFGFAVLLR